MANAHHAASIDLPHIREMSEQIDAYASQVSLDFEELTWLRTISEKLDCCRVDSTVDEVADEVLPSLCEVIGASTLALVFADDPSAAISLHDYRITSFGPKAIEPALCRRIVAPLQATAANRPVVVNGRNRDPRLPKADEVNSILMVSLARPRAHFGWLLAIDKRVPSGPQRQLLGEDEFGTVEAGMLSGAATLLSTHARNVHLFREKERLLIGTVRALVNAIDAKDQYTCGHSDRVATFGRRLGRQLGLSHVDCEQLYMTGLLHDIGKIGVPDEVLRKPGRLTEEEFAQIKRHPEIGHMILKNLTPLAYALPGVLHHHEAMDGSGYPLGLKGDEIPLFARILAVADSYDAMTSDRPYRAGMPTEKAEAILRDCAGRQWDTRVVRAFFDDIEAMRRIAADGKHQSSVLSDDDGDADLSDSIIMANSAIR